MSAETYAALEAAIAAHISDEYAEQQITTDWYLIAAHVGAEIRQTAYTHICSDSAPHSLSGLVWQAQKRLDRDEDDE